MAMIASEATGTEKGETEEKGSHHVVFLVEFYATAADLSSHDVCAGQIIQEIPKGQGAVRSQHHGRGGNSKNHTTRLGASHGREGDGWQRPAREANKGTRQSGENIIVYHSVFK